MTRISFLVPTYNRAHFIAESLQAILAQRGPDDEVVVVDDGSTDDTAAAVARFGDAVRYLGQANAGKSVALNHAMAETDGDYVWICDDDDVLRPGVVEPLAAALGDRRLGFVFGCYTRFKEDEQGRRTDLGTGYWPDLSSGSLTRHILEDAFVMQNAALVRREAYRTVGPFDETMLRSLDYEMFVRLAIAVPCGFVDRMVFDQRKHPGARGPASALHAADTVHSVWNEYDRRIFERLYTRLPLDFYRAMFASDDAALIDRAARLQRAAVLARHDLWNLAVEDLAAAANSPERSPLTALEHAICRRAVAGKHGFGGATTHPNRRALRAIMRSGPVGQDIVRTIASGVLWHLRTPSAGHAGAAIDLVRGAIGAAGVPRLLRHHFAGQPRRDHLVERDTLPSLTL